MVRVSDCATLFLAWGVATLAGCSDDSRPRKDYDPDAVAKAAIASCDDDADGKLTEEELEACLALQSAVDRIDANQDGAVDQAEIARRVASYAAMSEYIVADVLVKRGPRPLSGAAVTLQLAPYMNAEPLRFTATTDGTGIGTPASSPKPVLGFPPGFYDVEVVHNGETRKFGVEMADDNPTVSRLEFDMREP